MHKSGKESTELVAIIWKFTHIVESSHQLLINNPHANQSVYPVVPSSNETCLAAEP